MLTAKDKANLAEVAKCQNSFLYFLAAHCKILASSKSAEWIAFEPWPDQKQIAGNLVAHRLLVLLKARQLGFTWIVIAYCLWRCLFWPIQTVLLFSKRDDEAIELVESRLREMYERLPAWMRQTKLTVDKSHAVEFPNGSRVIAFSTKGGRSYTATIAVIDEADYVPDLLAMLAAVKPTIDAGGQLILLSSADKAKPESPFKKIFLGAMRQENTYCPIFCGWRSAPWRTQTWYDNERLSLFNSTGSDDLCFQEYPETVAQALAPRSLDKRIPIEWLEQCYEAAKPITSPTMPAIPKLVVYRLPEAGRKYCLGMDPAEGNPTSDDSACTVLECDTGEEVAMFAGKHDPAVFASYAYSLAVTFNGAPIMCERNNHGHAVILWLTNFGLGIIVLEGRDERPGWLSSALGKTVLYDEAAETFRNGETIIHSFDTLTQLAGIEGTTLRAPEGQMDDRADSYAIACVGRPQARLVGCVRVQSAVSRSPLEGTRMPASIFGDSLPWDEPQSNDPYAPFGGKL